MVPEAVYLLFICKTLVDNVAEAKDEPIRYWGRLIINRPTVFHGRFCQILWAISQNFVVHRDTKLSKLCGLLRPSVCA